MKPNLAQLARNRELLVNELSHNRRIALKNSYHGDVRILSRLTMEAARINRAISDIDCAEMEAR